MKSRKQHARKISLERKLEIFQCPKSKGEVISIISELIDYKQDEIKKAIERKWNIVISDLSDNLPEQQKFQNEDLFKLCNKETGLNKYHQDIIAILKEYMDLPEEYYALISCWIIGTYLHKQFSSYAYLFFNAMKGSGKTRLLKIIAELSKNGSVAGSMSEAVLFRTAKERTLCIDEFENMNGKGNENLKLLLNSAYKKGLSVERARKKNDGGYEIEKYEVYCPIVMANIWGMDNVLADRCISLILEKSSKTQITRLVENFGDDAHFKEIKRGLLSLTNKITDDLNLFGDVFNKWNSYIKSVVSHVSKVSKVNEVNDVRKKADNIDIIDITYTTFSKIAETNLSGRDLELFFPLFIIANFLSEETLNSIIETAKKITKERKEIDREENKDVRLIEFLAQADYTGFVDVASIVRDIINYYGEEEEWYSKGVSRALKRLGLVMERKSTGRSRQVKLDIIKAQEKLLMFKEKEMTPNLCSSCKIKQGIIVHQEKIYCEDCIKEVSKQ